MSLPPMGGSAANSSNPPPKVIFTGFPLFVRKFFVDFVETTVGAILLLNFSPFASASINFSTAQQVAIAIAIATTSAFVSAFRRQVVPNIGPWLATKFGTS